MFWLAAVIGTALDQLTKWLVVSEMRLGESIPVLGEFFRLTYIRNSGASFSILQGRRWLFVILTVVVLVALLFCLRRIPRDYTRFRLFLGVFCSGALGNLIDRVRMGEVVDFLHIYFAPLDYSFPIFNIADTCINVGVIGIVIMLLFGKEKHLLDEKPAEKGEAKQ